MNTEISRLHGLRPAGDQFIWGCNGLAVYASDEGYLFNIHFDDKSRHGWTGGIVDIGAVTDVLKSLITHINRSEWEPWEYAMRWRKGLIWNLYAKGRNPEKTISGYTFVITTIDDARKLTRFLAHMLEHMAGVCTCTLKKCCGRSTRELKEPVIGRCTCVEEHREWLKNRS